MLNIKNPETYKKAKELAALTGLSMTKAVDEALDTIIEDIKRKQNGEKRIQETIEMLKPFAEEMRKKYPNEDSKTMQDELYDENGLPV